MRGQSPSDDTHSGLRPTALPLTGVIEAARSTTLSLSDLLGAMSHALDMTEELPAGHSTRAAWIALRIADELAMTREQKRNLFYSTLLKDAGCSSNSARLCEIYRADDLALKRDFRILGPTTNDALKYVITHTAPSAGWRNRAAAILAIVRQASTLVTELVEARCHRGADIVRRLRFSEDVADSIASLDEHWDGAGKPHGLKGESVPLFSRIALLAQVAEVFHAAEGPAAAVAEVRRRKGSWFDPRIVDAFLKVTAEGSLWRLLDDGGDVLAISAVHEGETFEVDDDYLDDVAQAFADVIDAKTPFTGGHSDRVAEFADLIAGELGFDESQRRKLRRAALLHDIGKLGVSNSVLDKPGHLDEAEWGVMRRHPIASEAILSRIAVFADAARIGGAHHERLDGKGYPRGVGAESIDLETRIVTVADVFDALTADRPYRAAMPITDALAILEADLELAFDRRCVEALKRGLGQVNTGH